MEHIEREPSNNTALVVILAILVLIGVGIFLAYSQGYFPASPNNYEEKKTNINVEIPAPTAPNPPSAPSAPAAPSAPSNPPAPSNPNP